RRLNRKLYETKDADWKDMADLHYDSYYILAEENLPYMLERLDKSKLNEQGKSIVSVLSGWDYQYAADTPAPSYFEEWFWDFYKLTFNEFYAMDTISDIRFPDSWVLNRIATEYPDHEIFDNENTEQQETIDMLINQSFINMMEELKGKDEADLLWTKRNNTRINHLLNLPGFSRSNLNNPGRSGTLNATSGRNGPSWRMIVELKPGDVNAKGLYPGGQSGNPGSKFYDNMIDDWSQGNYYDLEFPKSKEESLKEELFTITLKNK
ncbi:MAG: penicillin acylase family protein, partial [Bacteroidota bacterium]